MRLVPLIMPLAFLIALGPAAAETIVVRSGEHEDFTRIVMQIPDRAEWRIESEQGTSKVILSDFSDGFDLRSAFEIIPKTRLTALIAQPSELTLQLACDCPVRAFFERDRFLVIDILDGPKIDGGVKVQSTPSQIPPSSFNYGELLWSPQETPSSGQRLNTIETLKAEEEKQASGIDETAENEIVLSTQIELLGAFSGAATRGLIETKQAALPEKKPVKENVSDVEVFDSSELDSRIELSPEGNIRITNSKDVPDTSAPENLASTGATCPDPEKVNISSWGSDSSFASQFGASSGEMFDEIGRSNKAGILKHAKLLLHFGFGAEALQTLRLSEGMVTEYPELVDLANIMEFGHTPNPRMIHQYSDCDSDFALWGILAAEQAPENQPINAKAALRALQNLPSHLKFFIAKELSEKLSEAGDIANAGIAMRSYAALEENKRNSPSIAAAQVHELRGDSDQTIEVLNKIIEQDGPEAPEALISIIQKYVHEGQPVPAELVLLAESYSFELRNTDLSSKMLRAFILSSLKSSQFMKTFQVLKDAKDRMDVQAVVELVNESFTDLVNIADDAEFLETYFQHNSEFSNLIEADVVVKLARRLTQLGFWDTAQRLVDNIGLGITSKEKKLVGAELLLVSGDLEGGLDQLNGMEGEEASHLRGELLNRQGKNKDAAENFEKAQMLDRARVNRWLSDDWPSLVETDTPVFGALTQLVNERPAFRNERDQMLPSTREVLDSSSQARRTLQEALDNLSVSE